jgi:hypothetical protein
MFSNSERELSSVGGSPGPQAAVDLDQRLLVRADRILLQRLADDRTDVVALGEEDLELLDVLLLRHRDDARRQLLVRLEDDLAGLRIDDVGRGERAFERLVRHRHRLDARLAQRRDRVGADLLAALQREVAGLDVAGGAQPDRLSLTAHISVGPGSGRSDRRSRTCG